MFGKPEWFRPHRIGWGMTPVTRAGWIYMTTWLSVVLLPAGILVTSRGVLESIIWFAAAGAMMMWDMRNVRNTKTEAEIAKEEADLFVIDENETESRRVATENYELHIRD